MLSANNSPRKVKPDVGLAEPPQQVSSSSFQSPTDSKNGTDSLQLWTEKGAQKCVQDMHYVDALLSKLGFDAPFPFSSESGANSSDGGKFKGGSISTTATLNWHARQTHVLLQLLNARLKDTAYRLDAQQRQLALEQEVSRLQQTNGKLWQRVEHTDSECRALAADRAHFEHAAQETAREAALAQQSAQRTRQLLQGKERHFLVELRKRDAVIDKLRQQLQDVSHGAAGARDVRSQLSTLQLPTVESPEPLSYNSREDVLEEENGTLRHLLMDAFRGLRGLADPWLRQRQQLQQIRDDDDPDRDFENHTENIMDGDAAKEEGGDSFYLYDLAAVPAAWVAEHVEHDLCLCLDVLQDVLVLKR